MAERRGRLTLAELQRALADLRALPIEVDKMGYERAIAEVLALAEV
jgi:hypothetical protein